MAAYVGRCGLCRLALASKLPCLAYSVSRPFRPSCGTWHRPGGRRTGRVNHFCARQEKATRSMQSDGTCREGLFLGLPPRPFLADLSRPIEEVPGNCGTRITGCGMWSALSLSDAPVVQGVPRACGANGLIENERAPQDSPFSWNAGLPSAAGSLAAASRSPKSRRALPP